EREDLVGAVLHAAEGMAPRERPLDVGREDLVADRVEVATVEALVHLLDGLHRRRLCCGHIPLLSVESLGVATHERPRESTALGATESRSPRSPRKPGLRGRFARTRAEEETWPATRRSWCSCTTRSTWAIST